MKIHVFGAFAVDELSIFQGRFQDAMHADRLSELSVSFVVEGREKHFGGCGGNIAYNLGLLEISATLLGLMGSDADGKAYLKALQEWQMDTHQLQVLEGDTPHATISSDLVGNQIALFAPGVIGTSAPDFEWPEPMDSTEIESGDVMLVSPENPRRMLQVVHRAAALGLKVFFDPGQLIHVFSAEEILKALAVSEACFVNGYEWLLLQEKLRLSDSELFERCPHWFITLGEEGVRWVKSQKDQRAQAYPVDGPVFPTGAGDAFRAGILAGRHWNWSLEDSVDLGQALGAASVRRASGQAHHFSDLPKLLQEKIGSR